MNPQLSLMIPPSTQAQPQQGFLGNLASGFGDFIKNNPEQFAIMADMIGSKIDPNNPFAGVGQAFGKSSLANKAAGEQSDERKQIMSALGTLMGGGQLAPPQVPTQAPGQPVPAIPGAAPSAPANPGTPAKSLLDPSMFSEGGTPMPGGLTPKGQPGADSISYSMGEDGTILQNSKSIMRPGGGQKQTVPTDVFPLDVALSGTPPVNMTGLTPEQIIQFGRNDMALGDIGTKTFNAISSDNYRRNANAVAEARTPIYQQQAETDAYKAVTSRLKDVNELLMKMDLHPLEKARLQAEKTRLDAQASLYAGQAREIATREGFVKMLTPGTKIDELSAEAMIGIFGPSGAKELETSRRTNARITDKDELDATVKRQNEAYKALAMATSDKGATADVLEWNRKSDDTAGIALLPAEEVPGWRANKEIRELQLPQGMTMGWVRSKAKARGVQVKEILKLIEAEMQGE